MKQMIGEHQKKLYEAFINKEYIDCFKYQSKDNEFDNNYYKQKLFVNPPYSKMKEVTQWIKDQYINCNIIYMLIPARTDTKYFHELLKLHPFIYFIKGRLKFNDGKMTAPFPSIILKFVVNYFGVMWYQIPMYKSITIEEFIEEEII